MEEERCYCIGTYVDDSNSGSSKCAVSDLLSLAYPHLRSLHIAFQTSSCGCCICVIETLKLLIVTGPKTNFEKANETSIFDPLIAVLSDDWLIAEWICGWTSMNLVNQLVYLLKPVRSIRVPSQPTYLDLELSLAFIWKRKGTHCSWAKLSICSFHMELLWIFRIISLPLLESVRTTIFQSVRLTGLSDPKRIKMKYQRVTKRVCIWFHYPILSQGWQCTDATPRRGCLNPYLKSLIK